jgi:DNA-directed RNA polymerase specialized sigma24 family protein
VHPERTIKYTTWISTVIDHALSDYATREVGQAILGDESTTVSEMTARRGRDLETDFVVTRCVLEAMTRTHAQAIVAVALAKDGHEASKMIGVSHAAFRQRLKRALDRLADDDDGRRDSSAYAVNGP